MLIFGISMSRISNSQNARACFEQAEIFTGGKIVYPAVGLTLLYSDSLYFYSSEPASALKRKFDGLTVSHKFEFLKLLKKRVDLIPAACSFLTWSQALLASSIFNELFGKLRKKYESDPELRKYIDLDTKAAGFEPGENQINFFLEESLVFYLIAKGEIELPNKFVNGHEKWRLFCYPGRPLWTQIYLFQQNWFGLENKKNTFENCFYDLSEKKLYDFSRIDLKTFSF